MKYFVTIGLGLSLSDRLRVLFGKEPRVIAEIDLNAETLLFESRVEVPTFRKRKPNTYYARNIQK